MWWRSPALSAAALVAVAALGLAGCGFQPLYGSNTTTASGARLSEAMASVDVTPIPGRVGQKLRNELIFANTGGGYAPEPRYTLKIAIRERVIDQLVRITGDARGQVYQLEASYKLVGADGKVIYHGSAISRAPYNRFQEIFANVRARYDAENRAARTIAESIRTQLAAFLATSA
ncbi:MAG: LPS assembly lipoprotein LptE [Methyloceanibacter sp.]|uniref:LPS assembly lipoprotein LptE n=1 Tax=Methyloceanibacter sp. TaxID=1965321 RepID=UPI003D6DA701